VNVFHYVNIRICHTAPEAALHTRDRELTELTWADGTCPIPLTTSSMIQLP